MKIRQHLKVGNTVYTYIKHNKKNVNLAKFPFLIGNIAPDLNCVYPAHRLNTTEKRFYRKLKLIKHSNSVLLKSYELGILTHYVCDYFCYPHNNETVGAKHRKYERNLWDYYRAHLAELENESNKLLNKWLKLKIKTIDSVMDKETKEKQCNIVIHQLKCMNHEYLKSTELTQEGNWEDDEKHIVCDLEYILFMAQHIASMIIEPFKSIKYT